MNLSKPKLSKCIIPGFSTVLHSLVKDVEKFSNQVNEMIDALTPVLQTHLEQESIVQKVHEITEPGDLHKFAPRIIPQDMVEMAARKIETDYPKEPLQVQVLILTEVITQLVRGSESYIQECLRQRLQVLMTEQTKKKKSSIITLP